MSSLHRGSSLPRRVFAHGLVLPFRLGSRHSRRLSSLPHASARVVPLMAARLRPNASLLVPFSPSRVTSVHRERFHPQRVLHHRLRRYASLPRRRLPRLPSRPNLKYEYEVQFSSCLGTQAWRSQRSVESSFIPFRRVPHRPPNPPIERTCLRHAAHVAR